MHEDQFIKWFVEHEGDLEEALADFEERFDTLLERVGLRFDDEKVPLLRDFLFNDYNPL